MVGQAKQIANDDDDIKKLVSLALSLYLSKGWNDLDEDGHKKNDR